MVSGAPIVHNNTIVLEHAKRALVSFLAYCSHLCEAPVLARKFSATDSALT
jgi:hypothetical protein